MATASPLPVTERLRATPDALPSGMVLTVLSVNTRVAAGAVEAQKKARMSGCLMKMKKDRACRRNG